jgi:hypothetical protein
VSEIYLLPFLCLGIENKVGSGGTHIYMTRLRFMSTKEKQNGIINNIRTTLAGMAWHGMAGLGI